MERAVFDPDQPQGSLSITNLRNTLRALAQMDLFPLRPRASMVIDNMEYGTDAQAQENWAGTGVTVTTSTTKHDGNNALQCIIDVTGNRVVSKTVALDLSLFYSLTLWEQVDVASSEFQFYLKDSLGNESYWDIESNGTPETWQQDTFDLSTPDSDNGTPADLSDIVEIGFLGLDAEKTYIFDTIKALCGLNVYVEDALIGNFHQHVYEGEKRITFTIGSSPVITPPVSNPRIDLLTLSNENELEWTVGEENSSPVEPTFPSGKIPICLVYQKVGMVKVVDYEDKDSNPTEGYIYKDVRPFLSSTTKITISDTEPTSPIENDLWLDIS
jgi:hypothetical protein